MNLKKGRVLILALLLPGFILIAGHPLYLGALGRFLVVSEPMSDADALVVLDGDYPEHERLLYAVQLWQQGFAPRIILSAKLADWQTPEEYPGWRHAVKLNILPADALRVAGHDADSTIEEARKLLPYMQEAGYRRIIIVTSNYHTRRAKKVFDAAWKGGDIRLSIMAAESAAFHPDEWWKHRADSRTFFYEFTKTLWYSFME